MLNDSWDIDIKATTMVGFDHENNEWDPCYLYMDADSLMASGKGKRITTGHYVTATVKTFHPETVCRVAKKFLELTGERPHIFIEGYKNWGDWINGPFEYHYCVSFYDGAVKTKTKALLEAIKNG